MFLKQFVIAIVIDQITCQDPKPCMSPTTWECNEIKVDPSRSFTEHRRLSYDARNKRERRVETVEKDSNRTFYDELILWNENKMYKLDLKTRKCNITVPHRGWIPRGPHPGDKFMSINIIGASGYPKERITVLQFVSNKTQEVKHTIVSSPDCIPLRTTMFSATNDIEISTYYDLNIGISDPGVWTPPKECIQ
uniref:Mammalian ependymin-related protein 1-like n=1 Tax=Crassostrea virginica TaxID=6565 RepID=A0A8B8E3T5_CRAVI|nr:mammalian ependymin-related protein 1-like [Crassostrea virginica]